MVVVLSEFVTHPVSKFEATRNPELREQPQRTINRYQPDLGASCPDLLQTLVLLRDQRPQNRRSLRRRLVPCAPYLPDRRP